MTDTDTTTGPLTSTGYLALAAENIRMAMHVDGPATPPECYDEIGALVDITSRLPQHLERVANALDKAAQDERLRGLPAAELAPEQVALETRGAAWRVRAVAGEKLRGLVRELNVAWTEVSGLSYVDAPEVVLDADEPVDAEIVDDESGVLCGRCVQRIRLVLGPGAGAGTWQSDEYGAACPAGGAHEPERNELLQVTDPAEDVDTDLAEIERRTAGQSIDAMTTNINDLLNELGPPPADDECPSCAMPAEHRSDRGYVPGSTGMPVECRDEWHGDDAADD